MKKQALEKYLSNVLEISIRPRNFADQNKFFHLLIKTDKSMSNDKFDVKISFTDISIPVFVQIFGEILKANPALVVGLETTAEQLNLAHTSATTEAKVVPLEGKKTSKKESAKSETKSSTKASKGGESKEEAETEDDEEEAPKKATSKSGAKSSSKSTAKKAPEPEPEEDEDDEESEMPEPVQVPEKYDMAALKQLIADINDNGHDVLDEVLEYFEVKGIKDLEKSEIKPFYKKMYKVFKEAESSDEDGE